MRTKTIAGSDVLTMNENVYDTAGRLVEQHSYDLNAGEAGGITSSSSNYTRQSVFFWHDAAGRSTTRADYGSGGVTWSYYAKPVRPQNEPAASSDVALVTKTVYNAVTGRGDVVVDAAAREHKTVYDALGRTVTQFQNYKNGNSAAADEDVETRFSYDGLGNILTLTAVNPTTGNQVTRYLYEDDYSASLRTSAIYPDSNDAGSNGTDQVKTAYYLDGNVRTITDQSGTVRTLAYDTQRRLISDHAGTLGTNVDGRVRKISRAYDWDGAMSSIASRDASDAVLDEVHYEYDNNRNLSRLYQSHAGAVNVNATPYLAYSYDDIEKNFRPLGVTYPSGKMLTYTYGETDSRTDLLNRVATVKEDTSDVVSYVYSGGGGVMQTTYVEPNLSLTYASGGLDRYGRIVNHGWMQGNTALVHILHDYDYAGNRVNRYDAIHAANSELYEYDQINQIKSLDRGALNQNRDAVTATNFTESWNFNKTGNWSSYNKNGVTEARTHNAANELQGIATHDANGNMTLMPGLKGKYDAWNRLVEVRDTSNNLIAEYSYNGLNQRISKKTGNVVTNSFFNENWQELESTKEAGVSTPAETMTYVWGLRYVDDLVYREKDNERLYSLADPNWNVVATTDSTGTVVERMKYDAFGKITWLDEDFDMKNESDFEWNRTFTGQVLDAETGLMLYRNRYYHVELGRFVSRDPIGYRAGDASLYRIIFNMIVNQLDPFGFAPPKVPVYGPQLPTTTKPTTPSGPIVTGHGCTGWSCGKAGPMGPMHPTVLKLINNPPLTSDPLGGGHGGSTPLGVGQNNPPCKFGDTNPFLAQFKVELCKKDAEIENESCHWRCKNLYPPACALGLGSCAQGGGLPGAILSVGGYYGGVMTSSMCHSLCDQIYNEAIKACESIPDALVPCCPQ